MAFVEDLSVFFDDFSAVPVVANGITGSGIFDDAGDLILDDRRTNENPVIRVLSSQFRNLIHGNSITVDGAAYTVREEPMPIDDGVFCLVMLSRVAVALQKIMLEDGSGFILLEDGGFILQEA